MSFDGKMPYRDPIETLRARRDAVREEHTALGRLLAELDDAIFAAGKSQQLARAITAPKQVSVEQVLALVASGWALGALILGLAIISRPGFACACRAKPMIAKSDASAISSAAVLWITDHPGGCPTVADLLESGELARGKNSKDPWGTDYLIECDGDSTTGRSAGPDRAFHTADDISG